MFSVFVVSRKELIEGGETVSFLSQWDLKRHGIVACGEEFLAEVPEPEPDREWLDRHLDWMSTFLERDADAPAFWKGRNAIGFILSGARAALLKGAVYAKRKEEITTEFARVHPEMAAPVRRAMDARSRWHEVQRDEGAVAALYEDAREFLRWARALP